MDRRDLFILPFASGQIYRRLCFKDHRSLALKVAMLTQEARTGADGMLRL
ncbi:hypothetical protein Plhal304r1_c039g0116331 [Plasmopara halstedii]